MNCDIPLTKNELLNIFMYSSLIPYIIYTLNSHHDMLYLYGIILIVLSQILQSRIIKMSLLLSGIITIFLQYYLGIYNNYSFNKIICISILLGLVLITIYKLSFNYYCDVK